MKKTTFFSNKERKQRSLYTFIAIVLLSSTFFAPPTFSQAKSRLVSVSFKDKSLSTILDYISTQSDYRVVYGNDVSSHKKVFTVSFDRMNGERAVKNLLLNTQFSYTLKGNTVTVFRMSKAENGNFKISGELKDTKGNPIPFASVQIKGTTNGVTTDDKGRFTLPTNKKNGTLIFSSIGYERKTANYTAGTPLKVKMREMVNQLGEVSVIAYGKRNTRELVGSISSVKFDELEDAPIPSVQNMLQGQMSGVEVTNTSGGPGGGGAQITIRGFNSLGAGSSGEDQAIDGSPLFVVDGIPVKSGSSLTGGINTLAGLDPSAIESVEVLKDAASAALYGSRAGNGVVLITTKKGKAGKAQFMVNISQSMSYLPKTPLQLGGVEERRLRTLLAKKQVVGQEDWMTGNAIIPTKYKDTWGWAPYNDGNYDYFWRNGNITGEMDEPMIAQDSLNSFYNNSTNWWDYAFRTGRVTDATLQISGGSENARYMISGGIYDEKGIMLSSSFRRASVLSNLDLRLTPKLDGFFRVNLAYTDRSAGADNGKAQGLTFDPKSTPTLLPGKGSTAEREALKRLQDTERNNTNYNIRLNAGIRYELLKGLNFSSSVALDHYFTRTYTFTPDYLKTDSMSMVNANNISMSMLQAENLLNYKFDIHKKHNFDILAGVTYNKDLLLIVGGFAKGGPSNQVRYVNESWPSLKKYEYYTEALQGLATNKEEQAMVSMLGRLAYNYKKKYLFEASIRKDGSSVFGSEVRWGIFPGVALGWAFTEEDFMDDFWWLNFGKIRASWGRSGQKFDKAYLAHGTMGTSNSFWGDSGLMPTFVANNMLKWEETDQYDIGIDLDMFNYDLKLKLDYYYKYSDDLLMQTGLPGNFFLANKIWSNSSAISNEGLELEATIKVLKKKNFQWTTSFNISRNWNLLRKMYLDLDKDQKVLGRPIYGIYTYKDEGIVQKESDIPLYYDQFGKSKPLCFQSEGYPLQVGARKIKDQNSDGVIDSYDLYYAGSTLPEAYGGWINIFSWKNFTLTTIMNYSLGRKMINMVKNSAFSFNGTFGTVMNDYRNVSFWEKPGDNTDYPSLKFADSGYLGQFDGNIDSNIETVNFIRLKQLNLAYSLPEKWFKKYGIKSARFFLSGENLFLLTNYSGVDPEVVDPNTGKDIGGSYPLSRKFTIGVNFKF